MLKRSVYFTEEQKFDSPTLRISMGLIYIAVLTLMGVGAYYQYILKEQWSDKPMDDQSFLLLCGLIFFVLLISAYMLFSSRLTVDIVNHGIEYRFPPMLSKTKLIAKNEIKSYEIRVYHPLKEYGGWGVKQGTKKTGKAINVRGKQGLQLVLKNDKKILFGTQRPEAIRRAMHKMMSEE